MSRARLRRIGAQCGLLVTIGWPRSAVTWHGPTDDRHPPINHVVIISVDGLRADALEAMLSDEIPHIRRLMTGPHTLNARSDPHSTSTLPNHVGMMTGRLSEGDGGHHWRANDEIGKTATVHGRNGRYVAGLFDVAHDHGVRTVLFAGKGKFSVFDQSWNETAGAPDTTGEDNGRDKIDRFDRMKAKPMTDASLEELAASDQRQLLFLHYREPDHVGHSHGWDLRPGSAYRQAIKEVDVHIGRLLDAVEQNAALRDDTAIILTSDHGGGEPFDGHGSDGEPVNFTIPLIVWMPDDHAAGAVDLYELNIATRADPGTARVSASRRLPPIRCADVANLALDLLDLSPVPGSTVNARQDLRVVNVTDQ